MRAFNTEEIKQLRNVFESAIEEHIITGDYHKLAGAIGRIKSEIDDRCYICSSEFSAFFRREQNKKKNLIKQIRKQKNS